MQTDFKAIICVIFLQMTSFEPSASNLFILVFYCSTNFYQIWFCNVPVWLSSGKGESRISDIFILINLLKIDLNQH